MRRHARHDCTNPTFSAADIREAPSALGWMTIGTCSEVRNWVPSHMSAPDQPFSVLSPETAALSPKERTELFSACR